MVKLKEHTFTFWGTFSDIQTEKKYLKYSLTEIQTKNRIALFAGGIAMLLVGISDFARIGFTQNAFVTIGIRLLFFLYSLYLYISWKKRARLRIINIHLFIYSFLVGNLISLIIYFLNPDKTLDVIDLITVPISFMLVYVFVILPSYFILISGFITTFLFFGLVGIYENMNSQTIYILSIIFLIIHSMGFYINRYLHSTRRLDFMRIREIKTLNIGLREEIEERKVIQDKLSESMNETIESLKYANHLQLSMLPDLTQIKQFVSDYFSIYKPCDIVSGDFYWLSTKNDKLVIAVADCTGHGTRAAFMSFIAITLLEDIVNEKGVMQANEILNILREHIIKNLRQTGMSSTLNDGLDIALCVIDKQKMTLEYAGAYNPLLQYRNRELVEYKADRMPISYYIAAKPSFTNNVIDIEPGDVFYIFSDGYSDQFGGPRNKKFMYKKLKRELLMHGNKSMETQQITMTVMHDNWKGSESQTDDIILLGFKI